MNTNFDNINNWAATAALKAGAAFTGDVSITTGTFTVGANAAGDDVKFLGIHQALTWSGMLTPMILF